MCLSFYQNRVVQEILVMIRDYFHWSDKKVAHYSRGQKKGIFGLEKVERNGSVDCAEEYILDFLCRLW
jgi:hypothetical protein